MRILLVEDDRILGASLKKALEKRGYGVDWFQDGEQALAAAQDSGFSAIVLDINLPKLSGLDILRALRQKKCTVPVLLLTARDTPLQKVEGLDGGADDYIVKPFDLDELLARLRALIRRSEGRTDIMLRCGEVELDPGASVVRSKGMGIAVTAREFRLLKLLMQRADKYITKSDIEYALYDADNLVESNTIEVTIYHLRKKLGADFIQSIRGVGYMVRA
ncbi:MAG: response regulator transcription factor [Pseudomonadota bacterium]